jgi:hypothetical protein
MIDQTEHVDHDYSILLAQTGIKLISWREPVGSNF